MTSQCLGDVLAKPGQPRSAATAAGHRPRHDQAFAGQMIRERVAGRPLSRERRHLRGFGRRHFGGKFVLGRRGLQFLQRQFELIQ